MFSTGKTHASGSVSVKGMSGLLIRFAGCCNPLPGDEIVGFISRGHGVTVHRKNCPNLKQADPERLIETEWNDRTDNSFNVEIRVHGDKQTEILTIVAGVVGNLNLGIVSTNGRIDAKTGQSIVEFNLRINSKDDLETLIKKLRAEPKISNVYRSTK